VKLVKLTLADGNWGLWSAYFPCSVTCGGGIQSRTRYCDSPYLSGGEHYCVGYNIETQICNPGSCPIGKSLSI
jgi:thrombospondin 1